MYFFSYLVLFTNTQNHDLRDWQRKQSILSAPAAKYIKYILQSPCTAQIYSVCPLERDRARELSMRGKPLSSELLLVFRGGLNLVSPGPLSCLLSLFPKSQPKSRTVSNPRIINSLIAPSIISLGVY
jgi:hypothetical protein